MTVHLTQEKYELKVFDLFSKENNKYLMRCNTGQFLNFTMQIVAELTLLPVTLFALRLVAKYCNVGHRINHKRKFFNPIFSGKIFCLLNSSQSTHTRVRNIHSHWWKSQITTNHCSHFTPYDPHIQCRHSTRGTKFFKKN